MSEAALERRCRRVARAYPDDTRADEVVTTLMESNAGRARPRLGDVVNVVWHGLATRLRNDAPGTRFGRFGDAASVAVVTLMVMQTTAAAAITSRLYQPNGNNNPTEFYDGYQAIRLVLYPHRLLYVAAVAVFLAGCATAAACLARVRLARWLTAATALAGPVTVVTARVGADAPYTFTSAWAIAAALVGVAVAWAVLFTGAVPRAARVVPTWWWGMTTIVCVGAAFKVVDAGRGPGSSGRMGVVLLIYAAQVLVLLLLAGPLLRTVPQIVTGLAMLLVPTTPFLAYGALASDSPGSVPLYVPVVTAVVWAVIAAALQLIARVEPDRQT